MRKLQLLLYFTIANVVGICIFFGWILGSQLMVRNERRRVSDVVIIGDGMGSEFLPVDSEIRLSQEAKRDRANTKKDIHSDSVMSYTLKPKGPSNVLQKIPPIPQVSETDSVPQLAQWIMDESLAYPQRETKETVLILTPIHNVAGRLKTYQQLLHSITYPHLLISMALGEDSSHDNTLHIAEEIAEELRNSFRHVEVFHFNITGQVDGTWSNIHAMLNQYRRRKHLAQARNLLLQSGLKQQDWVLWIDSDVSHFPPDIIQQLLSAEQDVVAPLCVYMDGTQKRVYDKNTWRETHQSLQHQKGLSKDEVIFEGYGDTNRLWLSDLRAEGRVVPIDGVGGCTLLVRGDCHRKGLVFPEMPFQHHMETEGLAKMAKSMNCSVYGMPFVEVMHS